jgi:hypothetical protein
MLLVPATTLFASDEWWLWLCCVPPLVLEGVQHQRYWGAVFCHLNSLVLVEILMGPSGSHHFVAKVDTESSGFVVSNFWNRTRPREASVFLHSSSLVQGPVRQLVHGMVHHESVEPSRTVIQSGKCPSLSRGRRHQLGRCLEIPGSDGCRHPTVYLPHGSNPQSKADERYP